MKYLIIGAGPGGYELAAKLTHDGHEVTLVERDNIGGTCLNRGCIPTKVMAHAASLIRAARHGSAYGVTFPSPEVDFSILRAKRDDIISTLRGNVEMLLSKVDIVRGEARFVGVKQVEVNGEALTADRIVIATGSVSASLPVPGAEHAISSDGLLALDAVPQSLAIIGGGVIGMEFAAIFAALGSKVTVIEYFKEILPQFDKDIAKRLRMSLAADGIAFITGAKVTEIQPGKVIYESGSKSGEVEADVIAMAVGRRPNLPEGLDKAGIVVERGAIAVDKETMLTSTPDIYAIGDVNGLCMLAHAASAQAAIVAGEDVDLGVIPSVVFTSPEMAMVGLTEQQCKDAALPVKGVKVPLRGNGKAVTAGDTDGMVKLVVNTETRRVVGCQIMSAHAADLIEEVAVVMANNLPVEAITRTIHPHPTLCEAIEAAAQLFSIHNS